MRVYREQRTRYIMLSADFPKEAVEIANIPTVYSGTRRYSELWNWAIYFCDFSRYQYPLRAGPSRFLSDVNISYKKDALEQVRELWNDLYHEPFVNGALLARGETLWLFPEIIVYQHRNNLKLSSALRERINWGRYYAGNRAQKITFPKWLFFAVFCPLLPVLLVTRKTCGVLSKNRLIQVFVKALPLIFLLTLFWSFGEFVGYVTARPTPYTTN